MKQPTLTKEQEETITEAKSAIERFHDWESQDKTDWLCDHIDRLMEDGKEAEVKRIIESIG